MARNPRQRHHQDELRGSVFHPVPDWAQQLYQKMLHVEKLIHMAMRLDEDDIPPEVQRKLDRIYNIARKTSGKIDDALDDDRHGGPVIRQENNTMAKTIDEALAAVTAASTRTDSIIADRASLKQQLDDALANVTLPADVQAKIDQIFDIETSDAAKIDAALNANVPPAEPTT